MSEVNNYSRCPQCYSIFKCPEQLVGQRLCDDCSCVKEEVQASLKEYIYNYRTEQNELYTDDTDPRDMISQSPAALNLYNLHLQMGKQPLEAAAEVLMVMCGKSEGGNPMTEQQSDYTPDSSEPKSLLGTSDSLPERPNRIATTEPMYPNMEPVSTPDDEVFAAYQNMKKAILNNVPVRYSRMTALNRLEECYMWSMKGFGHDD